MNIPSEVLCFVPKKDKLINDSAPFLIYFLDRTKKTKRAEILLLRKTFSSIDNLHRKSIEKSEDLELITLKNEGFELFLSKFESNFYYDAGKTFIKVEVKHPELESYSASFHILVEIHSFYTILKKIRNIEECKLDGTFSMNFEGRGLLCPVVEDNSNSEFINAKKVGKLLSTEKLTSKWIPGHLYLLKNREKVLYLGNIKNVISKGYWDWKNTYLFANVINEFYLNCNNMDSENLLTITKLINPEAYIGSTPIKFNIDTYKGWDISNFLREYLCNKIIPNNHYESSFTIIPNSKPAVDLGEYVKVIDSDITTTFKSIVNFMISDLIVDDRIESELCKNETLKYFISAVPELINENQTIKKTFINIKLDRLRDTLLNMKKSSYYSRNLMESLTAENLIKNYREMITISKVVYSLSKEELLNLAKDVLKEVKD